MRFLFRLLMVFFVAVMPWAAVSAALPCLPSWYELDASLSSAPSLGVPLDVLVKVTSHLDVLRDINVSIMLPPGWKTNIASFTLDRLASGSSHLFRFPVTPTKPVPNGSVGCKFKVRMPKSELIALVRRTLSEETDKIVYTINQCPEIYESFTDVPFALFPEEGFYPLSSDMWLTYDDRLKPEGFDKGPVLYRESAITPYQAQTDVEMYDKLQNLLKNDSQLADDLAKKGIDVRKKKADQLTGLYVLATEAYLKGDYRNAEALLHRFAVESENSTVISQELIIAAENLRALAAWSLGDRKTAEQALQKAFYKNRKLLVQRYILRNIALLMAARGDKATAREMLRLASEMKPAYSLVVEEYRRLKEP